MLFRLVSTHHDAVWHCHAAKLERLEQLGNSRVLIVDECCACSRVLQWCEVGDLATQVSIVQFNVLL